MQAIDQMKPTISRAMATLTTLAGSAACTQPAISSAEPDLRFPPDVANDFWQRLDAVDAGRRTGVVWRAALDGVWVRSSIAGAFACYGYVTINRPAPPSALTTGAGAEPELGLLRTVRPVALLAGRPVCHGMRWPAYELTPGCWLTARNNRDR